MQGAYFVFSINKKTYLFQIKTVQTKLFPWGSRGVAAFFPLRGCGAYWGQIQFFSMGVGQGTSWMSRQLIAGPLLMAVAASTRCQLWGSVSCSWILRHVAQSRPGEPGFEPSNLLITSQFCRKVQFSVCVKFVKTKHACIAFTNLTHTLNCTFLQNYFFNTFFHFILGTRATSTNREKREVENKQSIKYI